MSDEGIALTYDDVTFRYPGSHGDVLSGVSMAVPAGAFALLVGGTGSGFGALCIAVAWRSSSFAFYPQLSPLGPWLSYIPYAAWMFVPAALHVYERSVFA